MYRKSVGILIPVLLLAGCADVNRDVSETATALAVGDSILDWNRSDNATIPDVVGRELQIEVSNAAVGGATVLGAADDIPSQYQPRAWDILVIDGGGNDIGDECNDIVDALIAPDLTTGAMAELIDRAQSDGTRLVVLLGYYDIPPASGSFQCAAEFAALDARYAEFAAARDGVIFVDVGDAVSAADTSYYDEDLVHPSVKGGEAVGQLVADRVRAAQESRTP